MCVWCHTSRLSIVAADVSVEFSVFPAAQNNELLQTALLQKAAPDTETRQEQSGHNRASLNLIVCVYIYIYIYIYTTTQWLGHP